MLQSQGTLRLLAKLGTPLITPSNILTIGTNRGHLIEVLKGFPREKEGFTQQTIHNKDKQNYGNIQSLLRGMFERIKGFKII